MVNFPALKSRRWMSHVSSRTLQLWLIESPCAAGLRATSPFLMASSLAATTTAGAQVVAVAVTLSWMPACEIPSGVPCFRVDSASDSGSCSDSDTSGSSSTDDKLSLSGSAECSGDIFHSTGSSSGGSDSSESHLASGRLNG